ncbi:hypothetical protein FY528_15235 [Hymenobacter lutimineralis]|uniref:Uncharacterized protein n=1 Tax=Hymenobacter lutimineralis TaxID=2606448 RepID=A0A5D6UWN6_9BACT|nr:hypothetical protein [Hymenobacter lutimineralis]TYZ07415.1 hypothetical protein FY528_15235 [Hymenobacter lutimineralis]
MDLTSLDFQQARIKQVLFKSRLRSVLYGVREAEPTLFSLRDNPLAQWLDATIKPTYGLLPETRELERAISQMLEVGQALVRQYQRGQLEEARAGLEQIDDFALRIEQILQKLEQQVLRPH